MLKLLFELDAHNLDGKVVNRNDFDGLAQIAGKCEINIK
jgi:hypothetical protein